MGFVVESPAVAAVERLLRRACALGASDLHLDPIEDGLRVTARRDGVLEPVETLPVELAPRIVGRLKALADLLAYRSDVPQEGRIPAARSGTGVELRVATFPTLLGERVALRFDAPAGSPASVAELGLAPEVEASLTDALAQPQGVILLTGPSGSGKTTTLYACVRHIAAQSTPRTMFSIEDPIERRISDLVQTSVNEPAGLSYAHALRSLLRQDPDVLLLGEIRDPETASMALEAGLTGHLVASTIHAGTGPEVFTRLLQMGIEPFVLTTAVRGVLALRLVRRIDADDEGYSGRVLVAEWTPMTDGLRTAIVEHGDAPSIAAAAQAAGARDLWAEAERLVALGLTTREEVERVLGTA